jgi:hypothetical protein
MLPITFATALDGASEPMAMHRLLAVTLASTSTSVKRARHTRQPARKPMSA